MKELDTTEYVEITGGILPLVGAAFIAAFAWADYNWKDIKAAAVDAWNDTKY